jgi:hypothetical protein
MPQYTEMLTGTIVKGTELFLETFDFLFGRIFRKKIKS